MNEWKKEFLELVDEIVKGWKEDKIATIIATFVMIIFSPFFIYGEWKRQKFMRNHKRIRAKQEARGYDGWS